MSPLDIIFARGSRGDMRGQGSRIAFPCVTYFCRNLPVATPNKAGEVLLVAAATCNSRRGFGNRFSGRGYNLTVCRNALRPSSLCRVSMPRSLGETES
jgi:hypothetical protein